MSLYIQETGSTNPQTILFLHGGSAGWMWEPQVNRLNEYHCLIPDLAEQGQSINVKPFSIQTSAEQMAELIRTRAHRGKAVVVGLSEGAQVGVALLNLAPELIERAVISSALVRPMPSMSWLTPNLAALTYRTSVLPLKNMDWWIRLNMKYSAGVPEEYFPQFRQTFQGLTESGFTNLMIENLRFRLPNNLTHVPTPTLLLVGRHEYAVMRQSARDLAKALPNAQVYEVVHKQKMSVAQEHNWNLTAPELFTATIRAWVTNQPLPESLKRLHP
jgi:pimeloyl-ACP methyl ester carboxylesterase